MLIMILFSELATTMQDIFLCASTSPHHSEILDQFLVQSQHSGQRYLLYVHVSCTLFLPQNVVRNAWNLAWYIAKQSLDKVWRKPQLLILDVKNTHMCSYKLSGRQCMLKLECKQYFSTVTADPIPLKIWSRQAEGQLWKPECRNTEQNAEWK